MLELIQEIETDGARAAECFVHRGTRYLVIPQLAKDIEGEPPRLTGGNSDTEALVLVWDGDGFRPHSTLPVPGGEDAEFFEIEGRAFLATATLRTGSDPYSMNSYSRIFECVQGQFLRTQAIPAVAAKQWRYFQIEGRHFLALAQGASTTPAAEEAQSVIYEWLDNSFREFQRVPSAWGYNWAKFEVQGRHMLAYADHALGSRVFEWNGVEFEALQELEGKTGRAFCRFESAGTSWLAFACLHDDTVLMRWDGDRFVHHQVVAGPGGRELRWVETADGGFLVLINFIHGTREAPIPGIHSAIYRFNGDRLERQLEFPTSGATDCAAFVEDGQQYLFVANSLSPNVRFRAKSALYRVSKP